MGLSAHEQHALHAIEERLADSDPKLASQLAMFTRLTSGKKMPGREKVRKGRRHPARGRAGQSVRRLYRGMGWQRAMLLLWLLTAIVLIAAALAISHRGATWTCTQPWTASCASKTPAHHPNPVQRGGLAL